MKSPDTNSKFTRTWPLALGSVVLGALVLSTQMVACSLINDDEPEQDEPSGETGDLGDNEACVQALEIKQESNDCPYPSAPMMINDFGDQNVLLIDDPANGTTIGPQGWLFGTVTTADWVAFSVEEFGECAVGCVIPEGHPCGKEDNYFCAQSVDGPNVECLFCGPEATLTECTEFQQACSGDGGGGGADSTGGAPDPDGGVDETGEGSESESGEAMASVPVFSSNPDEVYGTTVPVLERMGDAAPDNVIAHRVCDVWDPEVAVGDWFGEPVFRRDAFAEIVADAELVLRECDHLRITIANNGVELTSVESGTLADLLGFRTGDTILDLNGVSATSPGALVQEVMRVSQETGRAEIRYTRNGHTRTQGIQVR